MLVFRGGGCINDCKDYSGDEIGKKEDYPHNQRSFFKVQGGFYIKQKKRQGEKAVVEQEDLQEFHSLKKREPCCQEQPALNSEVYV